MSVYKQSVGNINEDYHLRTVFCSCVFSGVIVAVFPLKLPCEICLLSILMISSDADIYLDYQSLGTGSSWMTE